MEVHWGDVLQYRSKVSWKSWLQTRILIFNDFENWVSRLEFQGTVNLPLTITVHTWRQLGTLVNTSPSLDRITSPVLFQLHDPWYTTQMTNILVFQCTLLLYNLLAYFITRKEEFLSSCFNFFCRIQVLWKLKTLKRRPQGYIRLCLKIASNTCLCNTFWLTVKGPIQNYYKNIGRGYICAT